MNFIFIFGPQAVGKMTVGQEIAKRTNYRLLHNHLTIDVAKALFDARDLQYIKFLTRLNFFSFTEFIKRSDSAGLVYTDVWMLNRKYDIQCKEKMFELFNDKGWNVYVVELVASMQVRLERNRTENRLDYKPTKRDLERSEELLRWSEGNHLLNSFKVENFKLPDFIKKHLIINNENLTAVETAVKIINETCNCGCS